MWRIFEWSFIIIKIKRTKTLTGNPEMSEVVMNLKLMKLRTTALEKRGVIIFYLQRSKSAI
jgi:hypothetical protein